MSFSRYEPWGHVAVVEKVVPLGNGEYEILYSDANARKLSPSRKTGQYFTPQNE